MRRSTTTMALGKSGGTILTRRSRSSLIAWSLASSVALLYFVTSLVVVINSFVWMATFPSLWYALQKVLYWPFQPYLDFTLAVLGGREISYQTYALLARSPFLI